MNFIEILICMFIFISMLVDIYLIITMMRLYDKVVDIIKSLEKKPKHMKLNEGGK